ncbi:1-pyrroline-5-carboxylate dehydrogenase, partial [Coemansia furcata]
MWSEFHEKLVAGTKLIKMGPITDPTNFMGPVINQAAYNKITGYIEAAKSLSDCEIIA